MIFIPYTYLVGWSQLDTWYYGVRYAKDCNPSELWKTYFTSSKYVEDFRARYGEPDIIEIRKTFDNVDSARIWEHKVLKRMNVVLNEKFLNKTDNISISPDVWSGKTHSPKTKRKLSLLASKRTGELNPFFGKTHSEETKNKIREANIGKTMPSFAGFSHSEESKKKISESSKGHKKPESMKRTLSILKKGVPRPTVTCPYCSKVGATGIMHRWHFDNCKSSPRNSGNS